MSEPTPPESDFDLLPTDCLLTLDSLRRGQVRIEQRLEEIAAAVGLHDPEAPLEIQHLRARSRREKR